jgi:hypothetical protein
MDRDSSVPKLLRQESIDPPTGQFDAAGDSAKREVLASAKRHSKKSLDRKGA